MSNSWNDVPKNKKTVTFFQLVFQIFIVVTAAGYQDVKADYWIGFRAFEQVSFPDTFQRERIQKSIFRLETFGSETEVPRIIDTFKIKDLPIGDYTSSPSRYRQAVQIASCVRQKIAKCPVYTKSITFGSGFSFENQSRMATALHVVDRWIYDVIKNNPKFDYRNMEIPVIIKDWQGNIKFDSFSNQNRFRIIYMNESDLFHKYMFSNTINEKYHVKIQVRRLFEHWDYVVLQFDTPLFDFFIENVSFPRKPEMDDFAYAIGYADIKQFNKNDLGIGKNVSGEGLFVSRGMVQGNWAGAGFLGIDFNAAAFGGNSGGPLLNNFGEVIGVVTRAKYFKQNSNKLVWSNAVATGNFRSKDKAYELELEIEKRAIRNRQLSP